MIDEYDEKSKKQEEKFTEGMGMDMNTTGFSLKIIKPAKIHLTSEFSKRYGKTESFAFSVPGFFVGMFFSNGKDLYLMIEQRHPLARRKRTSS